MKYSYYRNFILSKTDGKNVHKINGLLGNIVNGKKNADYAESKGHVDVYTRNKDTVVSALIEIGRLTGFLVNYDELEMD